MYNFKNLYVNFRARKPTVSSTEKYQKDIDLTSFTQSIRL